MHLDIIIMALDGECAEYVSRRLWMKKLDSRFLRLLVTSFSSQTGGGGERSGVVGGRSGKPTSLQAR